MKSTCELTAGRVREVLRYDAHTGVFTWNGRPSLRVRAGDAAGALAHGYRQIRLDGVRYLGHRLAWLYVHGEWPRAEIDHIDGNKDNNRIANLRVTTRVVNAQNVRACRSQNKLRVLGVSRHGSGYRASVFVDGKRLRMGGFETPELAHEAYLAMKRQHHEGCTV